MSVFDSVVRVQTPSENTANDSRLPHPSSLFWADIAGPAALAGTAGADCELVHGDRFQQTNGHHVEEITGGQKHTVAGDQTLVIGGKQKETITGYCYQNIIGPQLVTNHSVRNETRMARATLVYGDFFVDDNPPPEGAGGGGRWYYADYFLTNTVILNHEIDTTKVDLHTAHVEAAVLLHAEAKAVHTEFGFVNFQTAANKEDIAATKDEVDGLNSAVSAMNTEVKAINTDLAALNQSFEPVNQKIGVLRTTAEVQMNELPEFGLFVLAP
jgi:hypothetical protein